MSAQRILSTPLAAVVAAKGPYTAGIDASSSVYSVIATSSDEDLVLSYACAFGSFDFHA